jgi:hypothetical protein
VNCASKNLRSSPGATFFASSQTRLSAVALAQPPTNARSAGSSGARLHPGRSANARFSYRALSGGGFPGGHTGHGAHPAISRISARLRMWIIYLEVLLALALAAFIVWFTWPRKKK